jgi:hypothetical protein
MAASVVKSPACAAALDNCNENNWSENNGSTKNKAKFRIDHL